MRIAVHGDGIVAHLAALMLVRAGQSVTRVPTGTGDHGLGPIGGAVLGLPEWEVSEIAGAIGWVPGSAFALGIGFGGWGVDNWFWPFGDTGAVLDGVPFAQVAARVRADGRRVALGDFALSAIAAREERFAPPSPDPRSPLSMLATGITYPADALAARLAQLGTAAGVRVAEAVPDADLHVDADGACPEADWDSWQHWLPCNRAAHRRTASDRPPPPYALHTAGVDGWRSHVALDEAICDSAYTVDGAGTPYVNGMRRAAWSGNRVAVGGAAAIVEPVLGTALLLAHDDVARLIALLPHDPADTRVEAAEFNRRTRTRAEAARDAAVALWATNARTGQPLWDRAREHVPPALAHRIALYRSRGYVPIVEDDPLSRADWTALFDGQGLRQRRLDPLATAIPQAEAEAHLARIHARLAAAARTMPPHAHALAQLRPTR